MWGCTALTPLGATGVNDDPAPRDIGARPPLEKVLIHLDEYAAKAKVPSSSGPLLRRGTIIPCCHTGFEKHT